MKKLIPALIALLILIACNKEDHGDANVHITGTVKGLNQGKLYIQRLVDTALVPVDTIVINGKSDFESHLKLESPEMLYLFIDRGQTNSIDTSLPFFAEPGNIKIETSNEEFFARAKITGSKNHALYEEYLKINSRFTNQNLDLMKKEIEAKGNPVRLDSIYKAMKKVQNRQYLYTANFVLNHKDFEVAPYLAYTKIENINLRYYDTIQKSLSPKVAKSHYGKLLAKDLAERKKNEASDNLKR